jgi:hypothetical protein
MGNAARRQYGPRKPSPSWANNYEPPEGSTDLVRLIPGKYESQRIDQVTGAVIVEETGWYEFVEHYHGTLRKGMICTAGVYRWADKSKAQPCRGCDISNEDFEERKRIERATGHKPTNPNRMGASTKYAFIILQLGEPSQGGHFYKGYQYDRDNRVSVGKNGGQPFMEWRKYIGQQEPEFQHIARDLQTQGKQVEWKVGHVQTWPANYGMFKTLEAYSDMLQKHCKNCGGQNCLHTQSYACPHCSYPTIQDTATPADKVKEIVNQVVTCRNCNQKAYPYAIQACSYCQNGRSASIWDVDFQFCKTKVNKTSQLMIPWSSPPKAIDPMYAKVMEKLPNVLTKFAPTPYEDQVQLFGHPNTQAAAQQYQPPAPQGYQPQQYQPAGYGYDPNQYAAPYGGQQQPVQPPAPYGYQPPQQQQQQQQPVQAPPAGWGQAPAGWTPPR